MSKPATECKYENEVNMNATKKTIINWRINHDAFMQKQYKSTVPRIYIKPYNFL